MRRPEKIRKGEMQVKNTKRETEEEREKTNLKENRKERRNEEESSTELRSRRGVVTPEN